MNHRIRTSIILGLVSLITLTGWCTDAQAFWFGWFRNNRTPYPAYRPVYTAGNMCYQPVVAAPTPGSCNTCVSGYQPTTVQYAPQTYYRNQWVRVPVTVYRPVTVAQQPILGANQLQPCTTYRWQLQRAPSYRPLFSWFRRPVMAPAPSFFGTVPASSCASCSPAAATVPANSQQYYQQGITTAPLSASPAPGNAPTPADQRPSLKPADAQPSVPDATIRRAPSAEQSSGSTTGPSLGSPRPLSNVVPIPDLRSRPTVRPQSNRDIPPLLTPSSRPGSSRHTASLRDTHRWAVTPITWAQPVRNDAPLNAQTRLKPVTPTAKPQERWDDSGWRSASPR